MLSSLSLALSLEASSGSLKYTIMQVILSVPVPSDIVISPLASPYYIMSSIIKEVSPFGFIFLIPELSGSFLPIFVGELRLLLLTFSPLADFYFVGDKPKRDYFGPYSFFFLIYLIASSLV